jgi:hypothetical protein
VSRLFIAGNQRSSSLYKVSRSSSTEQSILPPWKDGIRLSAPFGSGLRAKLSSTARRITSLTGLSWSRAIRRNRIITGSGKRTWIFCMYTSITWTESRNAVCRSPFDYRSDVSFPNLLFRIAAAIATADRLSKVRVSIVRIRTANAEPQISQIDADVRRHRRQKSEVRTPNSKPRTVNDEPRTPAALRALWAMFSFRIFESLF